MNLRIAVLAVTVATAAALAAPPGVYHADPNHLVRNTLLAAIRISG